jgi:8-oxo-dGTP diphosphatase
MTQTSSQAAPQSTAPTTTPVTLSRRYPDAPLVGVGVAIYNAQGEVLLVQSGKASRKGTWGLPGGLIDLGETLVAAGIREVTEEVGVEIMMGNLVTTFEPIIRDAQGKVEYHYVVLEYWAHYVSGEPVAQDDVVASAWVASDDLGNYSLTPVQLNVLQQTYAAWHAAPPLQSHATTSSL